MNKNLWATGATAAAVAAMLMACGGGGGGGTGGVPIAAAPAPAPVPAPAPAPAPAPSSSTSSAPCTNASDFAAGTVLDVEGRSTGPGQPATTSRNVRTTGDREPFAGANPVPLITPVSAAGVSVVGKIYVDLIGGNISYYGTSTTTTTSTSSGVQTSTYQPVPAFPIDMQVGESASRSYTETANIVGTTSSGASTTTTLRYAVVRTTRYEGRENLKIDLGTFVTCRFTSSFTVTPEGGATTVSSFETWIAADGPYRGQNLKAHNLASGNSPESTFEATKITYTVR